MMVLQYPNYYYYHPWLLFRCQKNIATVLLLILVIITTCEYDNNKFVCYAAVSSSFSVVDSRSNSDSTFSSSSSSSSSSSFRLQDYVNIRCGYNADCTNPTSLLSPTIDDTRINTDDRVVWLYDGKLIDPLNGKQVAAVEGIELIRHVATLDSCCSDDDDDDDDVNNTMNQLQRFQRRSRNLQILKSVLLKRNKNNKMKYNINNNNKEQQVVMAPNLNSCSTLLSRKMFLYKPIISTTNEEDEEKKLKKTHGSNKQKRIQKKSSKKINSTSSSSSNTAIITPYTSFLLRQIRRRPPTGPITQIPIDQSIQIYDSAITIMEKKKKKKKKSRLQQQQYVSDESDHDHQWIFHTEFADGTTLQSTSTNIIENNDNSMNRILFTTYSRSSSKNKKQQAIIPDLMKDENNSNRKLPKSRTSTIQFGSSPETEKGRFGARETYMYQWNNDNNNNNNNNDNQNDNKSTKTPSNNKSSTSSSPSITVQYTRYGEAPVWYGPGRLCLLELTGRRIVLNDKNNIIDDNTSLSKKASTTTSDEKKSLNPPTLAQSIAAYIPGFWNPDEPIGTWKSISSLPLSHDGVTNKPSKGSNKKLLFFQKPNGKENTNDDDVHFKYYSDALWTQLVMTDDDDNNNYNNNKVLSRTGRTASEYRTLFADLKMGRIIDQFKNHQMNQIQLLRTAKQYESKKGVLLPIYTSLESKDATGRISHNKSYQIQRFWTKRLQPSINDTFYKVKSALSFSI